jgi:integrase
MKGHMRQRGTAWELRAYVGIDPLTKRHKYVTRTFRGGKRDAEEALAKLVTEVSGGGHSAQDTTVDDLIQRWFDLAKPDLSPTTVRGYEGVIRSYIKPRLGTVPIARLRPAQLDRFYADLRKGGGRDGRPLSSATVRQAHAVLRRSLQQAVRWGWLNSNPAALASPPRVRTPQLDLPDPKGVIRLIEGAREHDADFGCFLRLAATTGARRGELCALRWSDLNLDTGNVTIARAVVEAQGSLIEKDTKTHGIRRIALDAETVADLRAHHERMVSRAAACDVSLPASAHVFSRDPDGRRPWSPNAVTKSFVTIRNQLGLDGVRLHDLRHFAATRLLAAGVPVRTVSGRLGHSNAATTLGVYAHFVEESDRDAAAKLGALVSVLPKPASRSRRAKRPAQRGAAPVAQK